MNALFRVMLFSTAASAFTLISSALLPAAHAESAEKPTSGAYIVLTASEMERIPSEWLCSRCFAMSPALEVIG